MSRKRLNGVAIVVVFALMFQVVWVPGSVVRALDSSAALPAAAKPAAGPAEQARYLASLMDQDGYLSDPALENLERLSDDEEKYIETERAGDGTHTLRQYAVPVRYKDSAGRWQKIDNQIVPAAAKNGQPGGYRNKASDLTVTMAESLEQSDAIQLSYQGYTIGFRPEVPQRTERSERAELSLVSVDAQTEAVQRDRTYQASRQYQSLEYAAAFGEQTRIRVTPGPTGLKEDIILQERPAASVFAYELSVQNAVPLLRRDGNLYFVDPVKKLLVAAIAAPFLRDSSPAQAESYTVGVALEKTGEQVYRYTLTPDRAFLDDKNTVYPVVLDPSINTLSGQIADSFISSKYPSNNYVNDVALKIGFGPTFSISRGLVRINSFPSVLQNNPIVSARYCAYQDYDGDTTPAMRLHRITANWNPATVNYSNKPAFDSAIASQQNVTGIGWYQWDITSLATGWHNGSIPNYGICIKIDNEALNKYKRFCSDQSPSNKNYFEFTYRDATPPPLPASAWIAGTAFSGPVGSISLAWSPVTDLPVEGASGVRHYQTGISSNGVDWAYVDVPAGTTAHTFPNCTDNTTYSFIIRTVDNNYNTLPDWSRASVLTPDKTGPTAPVSLSVTPAGWTRNTGPVLAWSGITDEGNHLKKVQYQLNTGSWVDIGADKGLAQGSMTLALAALEDGPISIRVRGVDEAGNLGEAKACYYYKDTLGPSVQLAVSDLTPEGIVQVKGRVHVSEGSGLAGWKLEYGPGNPAASFVTPALAQGSNPFFDETICEWDTRALTDNQHYTLRLTASDGAGNASLTQLVLLKAQGSVAVDAALTLALAAAAYETDAQGQKTIIAAEPGVSTQKTSGGTTGLSPASLYVNNIRQDSESTVGEGLSFNAAAFTTGWVYPEGSTVYLYTQARDSAGEERYSTGTYHSRVISDPFDTVSRLENLNQTRVVTSAVTLSAGALSGSCDSTVQTFAGHVSYIDLTVDQTVPQGMALSYQVSVNGGLTWEAITPVSTDGGFTVRPENRKHFAGSALGNRVKLRAGLTGLAGNPNAPVLRSWSADVRYTTYATSIRINNTFPENGRGITQLDNTRHDTANGRIVLDYSDAGTVFQTVGSVQSTLRGSAGGAAAVCLEANAQVPAGTSITYFLYTHDGATGAWRAIAPGQAINGGDWLNLSAPAKQLALKAELRGNGAVTPALLDWRLVIREQLAGEPYVVQLVDAPENLSTMSEANYMTLLRWQASATAGVTYTVYRSQTPYFELQGQTPIASGLTGTSWSDYNLNYGKKFYYQVTAVKSINGHARESLPSNEAFATVVDQAEVEKRLGLQNYWSYSGFRTGSGTGYINVANGNLVYSATDLIVSDPFLAAVMRRTFNSQARTKTALGSGWDYSFNTCLLKEFDAAGTEAGMVLKDGDGSFHRFPRLGEGQYASAQGTLMALTLNAAAGEFQIRRKDGVTYHFDRTSMRLKAFSDPNGNRLLFTYNERGNLFEVENTVGEKLTLQYRVAGALPTDPDYLYVNEHPDMLASATWTSGPVSITYTYQYDGNDRLTEAATVIEGNTSYREAFAYPAGELRITDPENKLTRIEQSAAGQVLRITDAHNDAFTFAYTPAGAGTLGRTEITSAYGVTGAYEYDSSGLVHKKIDALGHAVNFTFNSDCLVTGMNYLNPVDGGSTPVLVHTRYEYTAEEGGNFFTKGNIQKITQPDGTVVEYAYDNVGYSKPKSVTTTRAGQSVTTRYEYDSQGNLKKTIDPEGKTTTNTYGTVNGKPGYLTQVESDFGARTVYHYDSKGRVWQIDANDNGAHAFTALTYAYDYLTDGFFLRVTQTDAVGYSTKTYYDQLGYKRKVLYPDGRAETWTYDRAGNVLVATDRVGRETAFTYDALYRLTSAHYPDGSTNSIQYLKWDSQAGIGDAAGNDADRVVMIDGEGTRQIEYYDVAGRLLKTGVADGTTEWITARYAYDWIGNCIAVTDNAGRVSAAQYNRLGQQTQTVVDPGGENIQASFTYDLLGNVRTATDGEGHTKTYTHDGDSRLESVAQTVDGQVLLTGYDYDQTVTVAGRIQIRNRVTDAAGRVTEAWFDVFGRKVKDVLVGDPGDSESLQTAYAYRDNGQVQLVTRNDGTKERYTYNSLNQLVRIDYYEANEDAGPQAPASDDAIVYGYDDAGLKQSETVFQQGVATQTGYSYDTLGRVQQLVQGDAGSGGLGVSYEYDRADRVTAIRYVKDSVLRTLGYAYDSLGRIQRITLALGPAAPETVREYVYQANGDIDHIKNYRDFAGDEADYIQIAYERNSAGLTTKITYTDFDQTGSSWNSTKKEEYTLTYDPRGYITAETAYTNYTSAQTTEKAYTYDAIGRLKTAVIGSKTQTYTYDRVGNRQTMSDGTDSFAYTYNPFNQLTATSKNGSAFASYHYDGRGNQVREVQKTLEITLGGTTTRYDQTTDYGYNLRNQLTTLSISTPVANAQGQVSYTSQSTTNSYNAAGQRIKKVENGATTKYFTSGAATLFTTNQNNFLLTENILDLSGKIIASLRFEDQNPQTPDPYAGKYFFYNTDQLGSTTAIVQPDGALVKGYTYDAFGALTQAGQADFLNEVTFTGSVSDLSSGLQYMNARFYNPGTGRFLTQDAYSGSAYAPWTQHLYSYCGNNPTNMIDPTGHQAVSRQYNYEDMFFEDVFFVSSAIKINPLDPGSFDGLYDQNFLENRGRGAHERATKQARDALGKKNNAEYDRGKIVRDHAKEKSGKGPAVNYPYKDLEEENYYEEHGKDTKKEKGVVPKPNNPAPCPAPKPDANEISTGYYQGNNRVFGAGMVVGGVIFAAWLVINDASVIGVVDNIALPGAMHSIAEGLVLCFG